MSAADDAARIYIGGLPRDVQDRDIDNAINRYGKVTHIWIARNPPGFAYVTLQSEEQADACIRNVDGTTICNCRVRVERPKRQGPRPRAVGGPGERGDRDRSRGPPPPRDDRDRYGPPPPRYPDDRYGRDDRGREGDRFRDGGADRFDDRYRDRAPPPRGFDDRDARAPPPRDFDRGGDRGRDDRGREPFPPAGGAGGGYRGRERSRERSLDGGRGDRYRDEDGLRERERDRDAVERMPPAEAGLGGDSHDRA